MRPQMSTAFQPLEGLLSRTGICRVLGQVQAARQCSQTRCCRNSTQAGVARVGTKAGARLGQKEPPVQRPWGSTELRVSEDRQDSQEREGGADLQPLLSPTGSGPPTSGAAPNPSFQLPAPPSPVP